MGFEEYVTARGAALVRFARLLTGDQCRAEDLVQEVLARAYVRWSHISRVDHPDVYLRRMVVNANISWWRRRSNREVALAEPFERAGEGDLSADAAERDNLWRLIRALPERQRTVLVLRYYEDLEDTVIAEILGCSPITVRTHAMRGLTALRQRYVASEADTPSSGLAAVGSQP